LAALDEIERSILGRKGELVLRKKSIGELPPEQRKAAGQALGALKATLTEAVEQRRSALEAGQQGAQEAAERIDLTELRPAERLGHLHLVTQAMRDLEDTFVAMGFEVYGGPELDTDWYNFEALNIPSWHPARSNFDTLFVDVGETETTMLRPHTSNLQIHLMEERTPPIYAVMPGRTYRRDTADATHMPVFHQIEALVVDRHITFGDLAGTIDAFTKAFFGEDRTTRLRPSYFPFTEPSAEFDVSTPSGDWLELGGCGMVHPNVFRNVGIDPDEWSGFAFGFGIDRLAKERHGVEDLRELFTNDVRFLSQF
ncbi:MAG: phenylalanine--tRNA ligase subunit alpha, partial [Acidimicrobiales bacterium]